MDTNDYFNEVFLGAALDAAGAIYREAVVLRTPDAETKQRFLAEWGGSVEPTRWITRSKAQRQRTLRLWLLRSRSAARKAEIKAALYDLEHANDL